VVERLPHLGVDGVFLAAEAKSQFGDELLCGADLSRVGDEPDGELLFNGSVEVALGRQSQAERPTKLRAPSPDQ
jgi:hypothetical protein